MAFGHFVISDLSISLRVTFLSKSCVNFPLVQVWESCKAFGKKCDLLSELRQKLLQKVLKFKTAPIL